MELFTIPDQGKEQYVYKRQQPVMAAAFPKWADHFMEGHYLYVPCEPGVGVGYRPWWHPMALGIKEFTTGFPPPPITWFEFVGQARTDKPAPKGRVTVHDGMIDLDKIRKKVEEVRRKAERQIRLYKAQEAKTSPYTINLTPAEVAYMEGGKERCRCGHLEVFQAAYESESYCQIPGCRDRA